MKVKLTKHGVISDIAICEHCKWHEALEPIMEIRRLVRLHVKETGHSVSIERKSLIKYEPLK